MRATALRIVSSLCMQATAMTPGFLAGEALGAEGCHTQHLADGVASALDIASAAVVVEGGNVDEACKRLLGRADAKLLSQLFALDTEQLRQGGRDLLSSGGALADALLACGRGCVRPPPCAAPWKRSAIGLPRHVGWRPAPSTPPSTVGATAARRSGKA